MPTTALAASIVEESSETPRGLKPVAVGDELSDFSPVDGAMRQIEVVRHPAVTGDVLRQTEAFGVSGDERFILFGSGTNAKRDAAVCVLIDREPREVLLDDHEASVWRMAVVGNRLGQRQTDRCHTVQQGRLLHVHILVHCQRLIRADPGRVRRVLPCAWWPSMTTTARSSAREVIHDDDNSWIVGDGVNDPNEPGACVVGHISHVVEWNSSVAELASLPVGYIAERNGPGHPWAISKHAYAEEPQ